MTAEQAVALATAYFDRGEFRQVLARRVALATESQRDDSDASIMQYLEQEIMPPLRALGFELHLFDNPEKANRPFLVAVHIEDPALPTLLSYGHGDVVFVDDENWRSGLSPWILSEEGDRWYGRGSADTLGLPTLWIPHSYPACGQHGVNEHMLKSIAREGLQIMTQLFWELGENGSALLAQRQSGETS